MKLLKNFNKTKNKLLYILLYGCAAIFILNVFFYISNERNVVYFKPNNINIDYDYLKKYVNTIHKEQFKNKINGLSNYNLSYNEFLKQYINRIYNIPTRYQRFIKEHMREMYRYLKNQDIINKTPVNILITKGLEGDMPYTIGNTILISEKDIDYNNTHWERNNKLRTRFINTLIHEYIHILQRNNQTRFDNFYREKYPFLGEKNHINNIDDNIKKLYMTNPDSNNSVWVYKYNNNKYIPILSKNVSKFGFNDKYQSYCIQKSKDNRLSSNFVLLKDIIKYKYISYHPNEIFANEYAEKIMNNKLNMREKELLL